MNREHKIRLAVINTAHARYPWTFDHHGISSAVAKFLEGPAAKLILGDGQLIHEWVLEEWRKLS